VEFHQRGEVGKAQIMGAGGHALDGACAAGGLHIHIQTGLFEIAFLLGVDKQGGRSFEAPVQLELERRVRRLGSAPAQGSSGRGGLKKGSFAHMTPWFIDGEGTAACAQDRCQCVYKA
jgi:hypothetical protein